MKIRMLAAALALSSMFVLLPAAFTQEFEKNSASNIFGDEGVKVQMYENKTKPGSNSRRPQIDARQGLNERRMQGLEERCNQEGDGSNACTQLRVLRNLEAANNPQPDDSDNPIDDIGQ